MKNKAHINLNRFLIIILFAIAFSCSDDKEEDSTFGEVVRIDAENSIVQLNVDNESIPIYLSIPDCDGPFPAVVVLHGSNGMWYENDPETERMSGQFLEWRDLLAENCIASVFVDSYSGRGVATRTGKWRELPDNFRISAQFKRPRDANAVFRYLEQLLDENGTPPIQTKNISLLGFSDGASAVQATLIDINRVPSGFEWTQSANGTEYNSSNGILAPDPAPPIGFASGVFYYGGAVGYNYWGKQPCGLENLEDNVYYPYAPVLFHVPEEDPLSDNTLCLLNVLQQKSAPISMEYYPNVSHGFDFDAVPESKTARQKTIEWFKETWKNR